jgi:plastocyanin
MKTHIGLFILVVLLAAAGGCTSQQATPNETATTLATPDSGTQVPTMVITPLPTTIPATVLTTAAPPVTAKVTTGAILQPTITASTKVTTIHIRNNTFVPAELTVLPGTGITWINDDSVTHIVKATGDAKGKFTSAEMMNGAQFMYTFSEATGTYEFGDPKYPTMTGRIIVKKGETLWVATNTPLTPP